MGIRLPRPAPFREIFGVDLRSLAALRVALGVLLVVDLANRLRSHRALYSDEGMLPRALAEQLAPGAFSPAHMGSGDPAWIAAILGLQLALAVCFALGLRPRASGLLSLVLLLSLHERNPLVNHAADVLLRFLLLWSLFLPIGRVWSVDAWLAGAPARGAGERVLSVASVALLLQPWWLYLGATVSKLQYAPWLEGRAVFAVLNKAHYAEPLGELLVEFPRLLALATWGTLVFEGALCLLLFLPWWTARVRILCFCLSYVLQLSLWLCLDIGIFQPLAMAALLPFLPGSFWDRLARRGPASAARDVAPPLALHARLLQGVCAVLLAIVASANLVTLPSQPVRLPGFLATLYEKSFLYQRWRVFANTDVTRQGWWLVIGETQNGHRLSLLDERPLHSLARPEHYASTLPDHHWAMFFDNLLRRENEPVRAAVADYYCDEWNRRREAPLALDRVRFVYVDHRHHDPAATPTTRPVLLAERSCAPGLADLARAPGGSGSAAPARTRP